MAILSTELPQSLETILDKFLDENQQATFQFRTMGANQNTMQVITADGTQSVPVNSARTINGQTIIRTPEGKRHQLVYSVGEDREIVNGVPTVTPRPEAITFEPKEFCVKVVKRNERELLARLLFSNQCRNGLNPAKEEPNGGYVYELIEPAKNVEKAVIDEEAILDAKILVRRASDAEAAEACSRLSLPVSQDRNANTKALYAHAELDPKAVVSVLNDEWNQTAALVRDLLSSNFITFDEAARTYRTVSDQKAFHNVLTGDQEQSLIKYLSDSQGQKTKTALTRLLEEKAKKGGKR